MRFALIREFSKSWRLADDSIQWRKAWLNAIVELHESKKYVAISVISFISVMIFIGLFIASILIPSSNDVFMISSFLFMVISLCFTNMKCIMIDDMTCRIIKNGLTSR
jgi:hypothetical protein